MRENFLFMDPWSAPARVKILHRRPVYVCLSGNSGAGKSTLLRKIAVALYQEDEHTLAIDEKAVHHHLLPYLFDDTPRYGYLIQLNFMIQRALLIKSWLEQGYNLVMERSHVEDYIFINFLRRAEYITASQYESYMALWREIAKLLPEPDVIVLMDFDLHHSLNNLNRDEQCGIRPQEFPDEAIKEKWLGGWHDEYQTFITNLPDSLQARVVKFSAADTVEKLSDKVLGNIREIRSSHASKDYCLSDY